MVGPLVLPSSSLNFKLNTMNEREKGFFVGVMGLFAAMVLLFAACFIFLN
jgi:hypothetical protein